jgi:hypothetical protein
MELEDKEDYAAAQDVVAEPELLARVDKDGHFVLLQEDEDDEDGDMFHDVSRSF